MKKPRLITLDGNDRLISDEGILKSDDGKELNVNNPNNYKVFIPFLDGQRSVSKRMTFIDAENILVQRLLDDFKFEPRYKDAIFDGNTSKENKKTYDLVVEYSGKCKVDNAFKSLMLYGAESWGCGKTYLINALANKWYRNPIVSITFNQFGEIILEYKGVSYQMIREEDLVLRILATYKKEPEEYELDIYNWLGKYDILALDDVSKYVPNNVEFFRRVMFQIVDTRYNKFKGLVISANFSKDNLAKLFGAAIVDRLSDMTKGYQLEFKGKSRRDKQDNSLIQG